MSSIIALTTLGAALVYAGTAAPAPPPAMKAVLDSYSAHAQWIADRHDLSITTEPELLLRLWRWEPSLFPAQDNRPTFAERAGKTTFFHPDVRWTAKSVSGPIDPAPDYEVPAGRWHIDRDLLYITDTRWPDRELIFHLYCRCKARLYESLAYPSAMTEKTPFPDCGKKDAVSARTPKLPPGYAVGFDEEWAIEEIKRKADHVGVDLIDDPNTLLKLVRNEAEVIRNILGDQNKFTIYRDSGVYEVQHRGFGSELNGSGRWWTRGAFLCLEWSNRDGSYWLCRALGKSKKGQLIDFFVSNNGLNYGVNRQKGGQ